MPRHRYVHYGNGRPHAGAATCAGDYICASVGGSSVTAVAIRDKGGEAEASEHTCVQLKVKKLDNVEGNAEVVFSGGKCHVTMDMSLPHLTARLTASSPFAGECRRLFDFSLDVKWEGKVGHRNLEGGGSSPDEAMKKISGTIKFTDLSFRRVTCTRPPTRVPPALLK